MTLTAVMSRFYDTKRTIWNLNTGVLERNVCTVTFKSFCHVKSE